MNRLPGLTILQRGAALQLTVVGPVPVVLEFSGKALVELLMAAQASYWAAQPKRLARRGKKVAA